MSSLQTANQELSLDEYRELAEFRYRIRCFECRAERDAHGSGIDSEAYLLLLAIQGLPEGAQPTITSLADRLCLPLPAVNTLVNDAVTRMDILRSNGQGDGTDWVKLTRTGRETLRRMAIANREDLENWGPELAEALRSVIRRRRRRSRRAA
ncbi:MAG: hypothetical protein M3N54_15565 [Acidobacteriota bacterium]|nr:hypothetical protein [Acidobacteriota bacterium]